MGLIEVLQPSISKLALALLLFIFLAPVFESSYICLAIGCVPDYYSIASVLFFSAPTFYRFSIVLAIYGAMFCYALSCAFIFALARIFGRKKTYGN